MVLLNEKADEQVGSSARFEKVSLFEDEDDNDGDNHGELTSIGTSLPPTNRDPSLHAGNSVELVPLNHREEEDEENSTANECCLRSSMEHVLAARRLLYVSHFFAQFSEVAWQFGLAIFLAACTNYRSMILVSSYGLAVGLAVFLAGPAMGRSIDASQHRLRTARRLIVCENLSVLAATAFCYILLASRSEDREEVVVMEDQSSIDNNVDRSSVQDDDRNWFESRLAHVPTDAWSIVSLVMIHLTGAAAQVMDQTFLVAMERDWVVVLSRSASLATHADAIRSKSAEDGETTISTAAATTTTTTTTEMIEATFRQWLSETNVAMKQIDLSCKVAAPAVAGFLIPLISPSTSNGESPNDFKWACLVVGALNVAALVVEFVCTARVYILIPALAIKEQHSALKQQQKEQNTSQSADAHSGAETATTEQQQRSVMDSWMCVPEGFRIYMQQASAFGGLGLAMLYTNSLTMGNGIMTTYLLYRGLDLELVGVLRGIASAIGLLGTFVYHCSVKHWSLETTGLWSVSYQFGCLAVALLSLSIPNDVATMTLLIGCVCLSRIGLWVFDIAVTQLQQQEVPAHIRGQVGGVQSSLNNGFSLVAFLIGILFPNPKDFFIYVSAGVLSVGTAAMLFLFGVFLPRKNQ